MWTAILLLASIGSGAEGQQLELRDPVERLRIESKESEPNGYLSTVHAMAVGADGNVYTFQGNDRFVRVFDASGSFLRNIGRAGPGPGEFSAEVEGIGFVSDTLWAIQQMEQRVQLFRRDGTALRELRVASLRRPDSRELVAYAQGGRIIVHDRFPSRSRVGMDSAVYRMIDAQGQELQRITKLTESIARPVLAITTGAPTASRLQPLLATPVSAFAPNATRFVVIAPRAASASAPGVARGTVISGTAAPQEIGLRLEPIRLNDSDVDTLVAGMVAREAALGRPGFSAAVMERSLRERLIVPEYLDEVAELRLCDGDCIWVRPPTSTAIWTVTSNAGTSLLRVRVPDGVRVVQVASDGFWGIDEDAAGVPTIIRYSLRN